ncbi:MAG: AraC family transcriptional regulator [Labilibaculum sp.]|nr:AraC family transcriptional regulator [Labilibaculum sp.]MBI9058512.1 AraC family transcriptional regulator [Labilibaculum sp.]
MNKKRDNRLLSVELENVAVAEKSSFKVGKYRDSFFARPWHYHPEFELLLITKGYGTRMVGNHFEEFTEGDLVLLGANLPHAWISDPHFTKKDNEDTCESIYVQFRKSVFGTQFIDIPELQTVRTILQKAERGIKITGTQKEEIAADLLAMVNQKPIEQLLTLIRVLDKIQLSNFEELASTNYANREFSFKSDKMREVHHYIMQNFKSEIDIKACAERLNMTPSSFCRFFKKQTNVTFSVYLNYMRINLAQKLICNTQMSIKEIGYECGYTSIVYFNQKFKQLTGKSPNELRKKVLND